MKIKYDFVTNSSSASFIISTKTKEHDELKVVLKKEIDLQNYISRSFTTKEEVMDYFVHPDDDVKKILEEIEQGRTVHILLCSDDSDDSIERTLCWEGLYGVETKDTVKIIDGEGRY